MFSGMGTMIIALKKLKLSSYVQLSLPNTLMNYILVIHTFP